MSEVTRFAPSPTNHLHLGHAYSAWFAWNAAALPSGGRFLLRIEDIDALRCKTEFEPAILEDMAWLGFRWETPVLRQSDRTDRYRTVLDRLVGDGFAYPCFCSRQDIAREITASGAAPHLDAMGAALYPGTCRILPATERSSRIAAGAPYCIRLDGAAVLSRCGPLSWRDRGIGPDGQVLAVSSDVMGDVVIARRDIPASYHLAATVDDADQGVTLVTRAEDLSPAIHVHRLIQAALDFPAPDYLHHPLILGDDGKRLAKRDNPQTLRMMRGAGLVPAELWRRLGVVDYPPGIVARPEFAHDRAVASESVARIDRCFFDRDGAGILAARTALAFAERENCLEGGGRDRAQQLHQMGAAMDSTQHLAHFGIPARCDRQSDQLFKLWCD